MIMIKEKEKDGNINKDLQELEDENKRNNGNEMKNKEDTNRK